MSEEKKAHALFDRLAKLKKRRGFTAELSPVAGGVLWTSRDGRSTSILAAPDSTAVTGTKGSAAAKLYSAHRRRLGLPPDLRALGRPTVLKDRNMKLLSYQPKIQGIKVDDGRVVMGLATRRRTAQHRLLTLKSGARLDWPVKGRFRLRHRDALHAAAENLGLKMTDRQVRKLRSMASVQIEKVLAPHDGSLRKAFRLTPHGMRSPWLKERHGHEALQVVIDAEKGHTLRTRPIIRNLHCQVSAFDENPVKSPRNIDRASLIVDGRSSQITATDGARLLRNKHFDVVPGQADSWWPGCYWFSERQGERAQGSGPGGTSFLYAYNDYPHIAEANTFVHLNRIRQMLLRVNPSFTHQTGASPGKPLKVYVDVAGPFSAFSMASGELAFFAQGGVGAGVDANLVAHEYGHQVHWALAPDIDSTEVLEAVADFISAIYSHDTSMSELFPNRNLVTGGNILSPHFSPGPYSSLREIYNDYRYPEDYVASDPYACSLILSGALMELHLDWYGEHGDQDYFLVPQVLLSALEMMPADAELLDAASIFAGLVLLLAVFSGEEKYGQLLGSVNRVFGRRGLI